jgi:hypothetical protein
LELVYLTYSSGFEKQTISFTFSIKLGLGDRWLGCKVVSMVRADQSARDIIIYFNEDPIDLTTDLPNDDGWKKYLNSLIYWSRTKVHYTIYLGQS